MMSFETPLRQAQRLLWMSGHTFPADAEEALNSGASGVPKTRLEARAEN
jgi:hypothetical protein